jgi:hypothetical protein
MVVSIKRIKELLNNPKFSDEEAELIRDDLQAIVKIIFEKWLNEKNSIKNSRHYKN